MAQLKVNDRIGVGEGRLTVISIDDNQVVFDYNRKEGTVPEHSFSLPVEIGQYLARVEDLENRADALRKGRDYHKERTKELTRQLQNSEEKREASMKKEHKALEDFRNLKKAHDMYRAEKEYIEGKMGLMKGIVYFLSVVLVVGIVTAIVSFFL